MARIDPLKISVKYTGTPIEVKIKSMDVKLIGPQIERSLKGIRNHVIAEGRSYIDSHRRRVSAKGFQGAASKDPRRLTQRNNLINTIDKLSRIDQDKNGSYFLSIGERRMLDIYVPYWYKINYGGKIEMPVDPRTGLPGGVPGFFDRGVGPVKGGSRGLFHYTGRQFGGKKFKGRSFFMIPTKPIPPMRYLSRMARVFRDDMLKLAANMKREMTKKKK